MTFLKRHNAAIFTLLFLSFVFRLFITPYFIFPIDFNDWVGWSNRLVSFPLSKFYDAWSDYLPGYLYVLWFLGNFKNFIYFFGLNIPLEIIYKFPAILADLTLVFVAYKISKKFFDQKRSLIIAAIFAFSPAIFSNSSLWGQIDALNTLFYIVTFIFLIQRRILLSGLCLAISLSIKPQGVFILPFIFLLIIKERWALNEYLKGIGVSLLVLLGTFIPFSNKINITQFVFERYYTSLNQYQYTSLNAFNFWAIDQRWWKPDSQIWSGLSLHYWSLLIFAIFSALILWNFWRNYRFSRPEDRGSLFLAQDSLHLRTKGRSFSARNKGLEKEKFYIVNFSLALLFLAGFIFLTRVHERLLLTPLIFLMLAAILKKGLWFFVLIFSITYVTNLYFSFIWITGNFRHVLSDNMINAFSLINVFALLVLLVILLKKGFVGEQKTS